MRVSFSSRAGSMVLVVLGFVSMGATLGRAEIKLGSPFTAHMVLQREMKVPVWGTAAPGEMVQVDFAGQKETTTAAADGTWRVTLPAMEASDQGRDFTVTGSKSAGPTTLGDVLVGEVWLGSGQSNMDFSMSDKVKSFAGVANEDAEIAAANYPTIRIFTGAATKTYAPQTTVRGQWEVCTPETAPAFSALSYFFARQLQKAIKVPVGIITESFGASTAESWIRREALERDPELSPFLTTFDAAVEKFKTTPRTVVAPPPSEDVSNPSGRAAASMAPAASPVVVASPAVAASPGVTGTAALAVTSPAPRRRRAPGNPDPVQNQHNPTVLYNGMIAPIVPYAIRGVIWYQGESILNGEAGRALYPKVQDTLIADWRTLWGEGDFPFYIVQLASLKNNSNGPTVREAQATVLKLKNTGMVVTIDIGDEKNVHPKDKQDVGDRLARIARANVYGEKIEYSGPLFASAKVDGAAMRVYYTHADGLTVKTGTLGGGDTPGGFVIAGADQQFVSADAKIDGNTVVVSGSGVGTPVAVRYAWDAWPTGANLVNSAGLPAAPFRSDGAAGK